ncbi:SDR family NAD(P)-dependent oxidoreductase [Solibacillus sp. FSL K6-1523]|uniref:SDR family NAD(P)-dependent oxidoreductase n=1 Tax=Solibacillus sp. FSL K6-1523 TaxID=2921471 RepID=UPI0030F8F3CC
MTKLMNQVALVTGAGTGLGRAIAKSLANEGFIVVLNGRREEKLREVEKEIGEDKAIVIPADVTNEKSVQALKSRLLELTDGKLNVLVNNVGGVPATGRITEMTLEQWQQVMDKNLTSQFLVTKAFLPTLRNNENGKIISVTSGMAQFYVDGFSAYSASKAGVESLMKTVAEEEKDNGIEVHLFDPQNVISEANPQGEKNPMEVVGSLIELLASKSTK